MGCLTIEAYCHSPGSIVSDTLCKQTFVWIPMIECPDQYRDPTVDKHTLRSYTSKVETSQSFNVSPSGELSV